MSTNITTSRRIHNLTTPDFYTSLPKLKNEIWKKMILITWNDTLPKNPEPQNPKPETPKPPNPKNPDPRTPTPLKPQAQAPSPSINSTQIIHHKSNWASSITPPIRENFFSGDLKAWMTFHTSPSRWICQNLDPTANKIARCNNRG